MICLHHRDYSILVVGESGSRETTTLKVFAQQRDYPDEPRVVFDFKKDWREFYKGGS